MLERINEIQGVGLLHDASGKQWKCNKATFIYADNGRGKSTLATIFRSLSTNDERLLVTRKTIDGINPIKIDLQFGSGHKVKFEDGKWSERRGELLVFDADFVETNVHSGGFVNTDHRKNLLEFALGEAAVAARKGVEDTTNQAGNELENIKNIKVRLSELQQGLTLAEFKGLSFINDVELKIDEVQKKIAGANNVAALTSRPIPQTVVEPRLDLENIFSTLMLSVEDVHENAEQVVKQHVARLSGSGAETWLSQGGYFETGTHCPYCNQDVSTNDLIQAYRTHFNAAYAELKKKVAALETCTIIKSGDSILDGVANNFVLASTTAGAWSDYVQSDPILYDADSASCDLSELREFLHSLVSIKLAAPLVSVGRKQDKEKAEKLLDRFIGCIRSANSSIVSSIKCIESYKTQLDVENVSELRKNLQHLEVTKVRYGPAAIALLEQLSEAEDAYKKAEKDKKEARDCLNGLMMDILKRYQDKINDLLNKFGAKFTIKDMGANFRGHAPRSEYGLELRGKSVALDGSLPHFATALSEGDKRTLAFAFFIASLVDDPDLGKKIVVIDDPMCSLDLNRRQYTRTVLKRLHSKALQLIVLAHDPYFLRDLRDMLRKKDKNVSITLLSLQHTQSNYTNIALHDIEKECESRYLKNHRLLSEFSSGSALDLKLVATSIRPMLEGYLHRRFPGILPKDHMFGQIISLISKSTHLSPLFYAKNLVDELNEINDYAGQFHHDGADTVAITASELKTYVSRALSVVHKGTP